MRVFLIALGVCLLTACSPDTGLPASLVDRQRILAVRAEPAESLLGEIVHYTALVASPDGTLLGDDLAWSVCVVRKSIDENTPVAQGCVLSDLKESARGSSVAIKTPTSACVNFGPLAPPSSAGTLRPTDPDSTIGYYLPIRLVLNGSIAMVRERVRCDPVGASLALYQSFRDHYLSNLNPTIIGVAASVGGVPVDLDHLPANQPIQFTVEWAPESAEGYFAPDPTTQTLVDRRESMTVAWFATAGRFDEATTGRGEGDPGTYATNLWQSPSAGVVHAWFVLRDSRGGTDFLGRDLVVVASPPASMDNMN